MTSIRGARASLTKCQPHLLVVHPVSTNEALETEYRRYNLNIKGRGNAAPPPGRCPGSSGSYRRHSRHQTRALGANHPEALKQLITETLMKNNRTDTMAMKLSLKIRTRIGCWNAQTMIETTKLAQIDKERNALSHRDPGPK